MQRVLCVWYLRFVLKSNDIVMNLEHVYEELCFLLLNADRIGMELPICGSDPINTTWAFWGRDSLGNF